MDRWPTFAEAKSMAKRASEQGFGAQLHETTSGWAWTIAHVASGLTFDGHTSARSKAVACVLMLQSIPVVS